MLPKKLERKKKRKRYGSTDRSKSVERKNDQICITMGKIVVFLDVLQWYCVDESPSTSNLQ